MEHLFEDAFDFLMTSTRTYVTALHLRDKFLAIQLILISEVMSVDALLYKFKVERKPLDEQDIEKLSLERVSTYKERIRELQILEAEKNDLFKQIEPTLSSRLNQTVEYVMRFYDSDFKVLLDINFKELLNDAQNFIFIIKKLLYENGALEQK